MRWLIYLVFLSIIFVSWNNLIFCKENKANKMEDIKMSDVNYKDYELHGQYHHYLGIELNMQTWNLLMKKERTSQDESRMIAFALGSQFHWYKSPNWQPVNAQRGEWLISHVYSVLGREDRAVEHAKNCMKFTEDQDLKDFDLAYAYEAMARAYASAKDLDNFEKYYELAKTAGEEIAGKDDKKIFMDDFEAEPWYK